jgi:hypothetical protein
MDEIQLWEKKYKEGVNVGAERARMEVPIKQQDNRIETIELPQEVKNICKDIVKSRMAGNLLFHLIYICSNTLYFYSGKEIRAVENSSETMWCD